MDELEKSIQQRMRNALTSIGINTVEQFLGLDEVEIQEQILHLYFHIMLSSPGLDVQDVMPKMSSIPRQECFEDFMPLITLILANKTKSNQEIFDFIAETFIGPLGHPDFSLAPVRFKTSRLVDSWTFKWEFLPVLLRQLKGVMYTNVQGLVKHFIQQHNIDPTLLVQPHESFINQKYEEILPDRSQRSLLNWLTLLVEHLSTWLDKETPPHQHSRTWQVYPSGCFMGNDGNRKLNAAITSRSFECSKHSRDILVPVEVKPNICDTPEAELALAICVSEVFQAQPTRRHVLGFALCATSVRLWQFDRSGAIGSELFDIKETKDNLYDFTKLILLFLMCDKQVLGFDPTFIDTDWQSRTRTRKSQKIQINTESGPQELVIDHLVFRALKICGRGTTCWQAHLSGNEHQKFLIKESWQPQQQKQEGEILRDMTQQNIPHMVQYHHHEDVNITNQIVNIESHVWAGFEFRNAPQIEFTDDSDIPIKTNEFVNRVHRRLILKDVGRPIWKARTPIHLLEAFEGCIRGHQALLNAGYLHRDISLNNIMINNRKDDPDRTSFLIDLDAAIAYPIVDEEERHARIGTKFFMSYGLLSQENPHDFQDDLESFFWVLAFVCIYYPARERKRKTCMSHWDRLCPLGLADIKKVYLGKLARHRLIDDFTPHYAKSEPLIRCVHKFADIMCDPYALW